MAFQTSVGDEIEIGGVLYKFGAHPAAPALPYGQEGRQGVVYQLRPKNIGTTSDWKALKVFRPKFRTPSLVYQSEIFESFAGLPGLTVCERLVLTPEKHTALLKEHHDLLYAVVMPWIDGPTWMDILLEKEDLSEAQCRMLAIGLAKVLSVMEQRGVAHCDLSAPNVLLPCLSESGIGAEASPIQLVDVEGLFNTKLNKPDILPGGSPGYAAHRTAPSGLWGHQADRFAGAVLLAEMLGWADPEVRTNAWAESYFEPSEMQQPGHRYDVLIEALRKHAGDAVVRLFTQAWQSEELHQCPTFGEWLMILLDLEAEKGVQVQVVTETPGPELITSNYSGSSDSSGTNSSSNLSGSNGTNGDTSASKTTIQPEINLTDRVNHLLAEGKKLEDSKQWEAALATYREVLGIIPMLSTQAQELQIIMSRIEMILQTNGPKVTTGPKDLINETVVTQSEIGPKPSNDNQGNKDGNRGGSTKPTIKPQTNPTPKPQKPPKSGTKIFFLTVGWTLLGLVGLGVIIFLILFIIGLTHPST